MVFLVALGPASREDHVLGDDIGTMRRHTCQPGSPMTTFVSGVLTRSSTVRRPTTLEYPVLSGSEVRSLLAVGAETAVIGAS